MTPPATATLTEIAAMSNGTTQNGVAVTTLLTSTQWPTVAHVPGSIVTPPATATLTEIAATNIITTHHGVVVTTLLTSTQWPTAAHANMTTISQSNTGNQRRQASLRLQRLPRRSQPRLRSQRNRTKLPRNFWKNDKRKLKLLELIKNQNIVNKCC